MQYYISWTHSDPIYHQYIRNLGVLVSPPNVNLQWQVTAWPLLPATLIIDSGAYQYYREGRAPDPSAVLTRQLQRVRATQVPTAICHLDVPMLGTRNFTELDRRVRQSLKHAQWLRDYIAQTGFPAHIRPLAVIQGYDVPSIYNVAQLLADMGYDSFAVGSLAGMVANGKDELLRRVEAALEAVGPNLHILGVGSVNLLTALARLGVQSADSGAPIREAWHGGIFYSRPFRRYKIASPYFREWRRTYSFSELLTAPQPCDCPVCLEDSSRLLEVQGKHYVNLRALHNCYHLTRELADSLKTAS
jgi:tRNA-guanine family transglycosylase